MPPNVTLAASPLTNPLNAAVPLAVALVVRSYSLLTPVNPVTVNAFAVTAFPEAAVVIFMVVAPVLVSVIVLEL